MTKRAPYGCTASLGQIKECMHDDTRATMHATARRETQAKIVTNRNVFSDQAN